MKRWIPAAVFALLVLAWGYFIWPTPWAYHTPSGFGDANPGTWPCMMRRHRITGEVQWIRSGKSDWYD